MKNKYYSLKNILSRNALYNVIFGERSNGKTYSVLYYALERYIKHGEQLAIVRRWSEDFIGKRGAVMFQAIEKNGAIAELSTGEWTNVYYYGSRWYLCRYDDNGNRITQDTPFAYGFSISAVEHDKSTAYPNITTILFDEFISRTGYITDEFVLFVNVLSTIIRDRTNVKIFMLGNTVNRYCPYFAEMGLKHIRDMKPGDIDVYRYGDSDLTVAVEYTAPTKQGKPSDIYFAFDNPKLSMITGGEWEIDIYPHCPHKFKPKDIILTFFICFSGDILQCEVVSVDDLLFVFVHKKTTPIKNHDMDLIFSPEFSPRPNYRRKINQPTDKLTGRIAELFKADKVFYADNETGEIMRNYLMFCKAK